MKRIFTFILPAIAILLTSALPSFAQWSVVGSSGISGSVANYTDVAVDGSGNVYVAYKDNSKGDKLSVKKYNGTSWSTVGSLGVSPGSVNYVSLAVSGNDVYVAFQDWSKWGKASVMHYDGNSWSYLGTGGFTSDQIYFIDIALDNSGKVHVAYQDKNRSYKATCAKYTGSSWVAVGNVGFTSGIADYTSIAIDKSNNVYVGYRDNNTGYKARVMKFNGSSWSTVGSPTISTGMAEYTKIAVDDNGTPYIVYRDHNKNYKATVEKYNGSNWVPVGTEGFSGGGIRYTDIAIDGNGTLFVAYLDETKNQKATVMSFNGSTWSAVGTAGFTSNTVAYVSLAISPTDNTMYVAYKDNAVGQKATVMKHAGAAPATIKWDGSSSTSWSTASNWSTNTVPTTSDNITIPSGLSRYPEVSSGTASCKNLTIQASAGLSVKNSGKLVIAGIISNSGVFDATDGYIVLKGSAAQTIDSGTFANKTVKQFELDNSAGASIADTLNITHTYYPTSGKMNTNDKLILKSNSSRTARIAEGSSSGNYMTGKVTVEQYIPGKRAFRFVSHPFTSAINLQQLIDDIDITGKSGSSNGFTPVQVNAPSAFYFDVSTADNSTTGNNPGWKDFTSTYPNYWDPNEMARIFIRGSKWQGLDGSPYTPNPVTIDMTGAVNQGDKFVGMGKGANSNYIIVTNPFASAVNLKNVYRTNCSSTFCVWDPNQGTRGGYTAHQFWYDFNLPAYSAFVTTVSWGKNAAYFNFQEKDKTSGTPKALFKGTAATDYLIEFKIEDSTTYWDRLVINFDSLGMAVQDSFDMEKLINPDLDFFSISDDGTDLSIDVRQFEDGKVIPLGLTVYDDMELAIKVPEFSVPPGAKVYLHDKFLNKTEEISAGYEYWFTTTSDSNSYGRNRFSLNVIDAPNAIHQVNAVENARMQLIPNPAHSTVKVSFDKLSEIATVRLTDITGKVVYTQDVNNNNGSVVINLNDIPNGIYIVTLQGQNTRVVEKLIKQ